jgi:hypothetical protein
MYNNFSNYNSYSPGPIDENYIKYKVDEFASILHGISGNINSISNTLYNTNTILQNANYGNVKYKSMCSVLIVQDKDEINVKIFNREPTHKELETLKLDGNLSTNVNLKYDVERNKLELDFTPLTKVYACSFAYIYNWESEDVFSSYYHPTHKDYFKIVNKYPTGELVFKTKSSFFGLFKSTDVYYKITNFNIKKVEVDLHTKLKIFANVKTVSFYE